MQVWGQGPRDSTKGVGRVWATHPASSWASSDCESGFWLYTTGRWGRSDESAGGRISRPRDETRETVVIKVLLCSSNKTCLQWSLCTCRTKPSGSVLGRPNQFIITPVPSWVEAAVWRWLFAVHLVSVTPGAAEQQLRQQQGILGWEARAAPSATPLSASQSSCSKQRRREHRQAGVLIQSFTILSRFIISADVKSNTKQT